MSNVRVIQIPVMIGDHVAILEFGIIPGLRLEQTVDSRRITIRELHGYKTIDLPIQAVEEFVTWWTNHGPIPTEVRSRSKETQT